MPEKNKKTTPLKKLVELAHKNGVLVEGEVGAIFGYADETTPPYDEIFANRTGFTTAEEVERMAKEAGVDWLSVAVGNLHGAMVGSGRLKEKVAARLDVDLVETLSKAIEGPLVIHGGSSIEIDCLLSAIRKGVAKINVAKDIRMIYQTVIQEKNDIKQAQQEVYDRVRWLIKEHYRISGISKIVRGEK